MKLDQAIANTRAHLLSLRNAAGHWEGELSSSALSTATAIVALSLVDEEQHRARIASGAQWLVAQQNTDGGWGDTTISRSNLSTTLLCWSALSLVAKARANRCPEEIVNDGPVGSSMAATFTRCEAWIRERVGSLEPDAICRAVVARYGKDRTFSVPILMTCAIGGRLGPHDEAWRRVLALPFELAAFPRSWFGAIGLPVVSYALPALIAIGHARFFHAPPRWWNPLRWLRARLWPRISPMLKTLQPSTGGYLEATPLTSFVTMALASSGQKDHPCVPEAVRFLVASQREEGSWAIDTNLATWATTLSVQALQGSVDTSVRAHDPSGDEAAKVDETDRSVRAPVKDWLLSQQYKVVHPFTNAAPGGWAWTDLPGGVPDADDTCGALIALWHLCDSDEERSEIVPVVEAGIGWLLDLQNRDGGMPTFCRGWGTLPFDRSSPELTAHALLAWWRWHGAVDEKFRERIRRATHRALGYLKSHQGVDGSWIPLWFGNEHTKEEENPVYGTAKVVICLSGCDVLAGRTEGLCRAGVKYLLGTQKPDGAWGGDADSISSVEETGLALTAIARFAGHEQPAVGAVARAAGWLMETTQCGTVFHPSPIGLYFAKLWYHERTYSVIWTLAALTAVQYPVRGARLSSSPQLP